MELAIINGTYRDNSNGQKQNGMTGTKLAAIPANIAFPLQNGQFRLPNIVPTAMPGLMNASVLRNPVRLMWYIDENFVNKAIFPSFKGVTTVFLKFSQFR